MQIGILGMAACGSRALMPLACDGASRRVLGTAQRGRPAAILFAPSTCWHPRHTRSPMEHGECNSMRRERRQHGVLGWHSSGPLLCICFASIRQGHMHRMSPHCCLLRLCQVCLPAWCLLPGRHAVIPLHIHSHRARMRASWHPLACVTLCQYRDDRAAGISVSCLGQLPGR